MIKRNLYKNKDFLQKRYVHDKKTPEEIAQECGCSTQTIYTYLNMYNLRFGRKGRR